MDLFLTQCLIYIVHLWVFWKLQEQINRVQKEAAVSLLVPVLALTLHRLGPLRGFGGHNPGSPPWEVMIGQWMAAPLTNCTALY